MELNIVNEVAALQGFSAGQLRQRFAELFGEATPASNRTWLITRIAWRMHALAEGDGVGHQAFPPKTGEREEPKEGAPNRRAGIMERRL